MGYFEGAGYRKLETRGTVHETRGTKHGQTANGEWQTANENPVIASGAKQSIEKGAGFQNPVIAVDVK